MQTDNGSTTPKALISTSKINRSKTFKMKRAEHFESRLGTETGVKYIRIDWSSPMIAMAAAHIMHGSTVTYLGGKDQKHMKVVPDNGWKAFTDTHKSQSLNTASVNIFFPAASQASRTSSIATNSAWRVAFHCFM